MVVTTRFTRFALSAALLSLGLFCGYPGAQGQSQGRGRAGAAPATSAAVVVVFRDADRVSFRNYFQTHPMAVQVLPPGVAKNVAKGKPLPPGIAKQSLPADLIAIAPKVDKDVSFALVGDIVVALKGGLVIDLMVGLFK